MSASPSKDPWGEFWQRNSGGGTTGESGSQRWDAIERAQQTAWRGFIAGVSQNAAILDLATGDGRVLRWMKALRPDLHLTGIDLAPQLPPAPPGTETLGGISMDDLPFPDGRFHAVVSQFGFEYGDIKKTSAEIARVLAPGGTVALLMHRGDGTILEHNRARRTALLWALREKGVARKAKAALQAGPDGIDKAARLATKVAEQGAKRFGEQSPAWEAPEAIRRSCIMGRRAGIESITETIAMIEGHARNELGRIQSLTNACATADKREAIHTAFTAHGLVEQDTQAICEPSGRAFADFVVLG